MLIPSLFFLGAVILAVIIVLYSRKQSRQRHAVRYEPKIDSKKSSGGDHFKVEEAPQQADDVTDTAQTQYTAQSTANNAISSDDIIVLHIIANEQQPYAGYELLQAMLSSGLRFGKMNIFHCYENNNGTGNILFSVASIQEPGTFEMNKMGGFSTPGLALFMRINNSAVDPLAAFDSMVTVAKQLTDDLGGEILDDQRQPLTEEKIQWRQQRIQQWVLNQKTPDLFEQSDILV